jgi:hypothetical protein
MKMHIQILFFSAVLFLEFNYRYANTDQPLDIKPDNIILNMAIDSPGFDWLSVVIVETLVFCRQG